MYNALSVKHEVPMGAYDINKLAETPISLRFGRNGDVFNPLGGKPEDYAINDKVPVYAIGSKIICWCFNHRDSKDTCVDETSGTVLFVCESIDGSQYGNQDKAVEELRRILNRGGVEISEVATNA